MLLPVFVSAEFVAVKVAAAVAAAILAAAAAAVAVPVGGWGCESEGPFYCPEPAYRCTLLMSKDLTSQFDQLLMISPYAALSIVPSQPAGVPS